MVRQKREGVGPDPVPLIQEQGSAIPFRNCWRAALQVHLSLYLIQEEPFRCLGVSFDKSVIQRSN